MNVFWNRVQKKLRGVITLYPENKRKGRVLLSYITSPFLYTDQRLPQSHTNFWECKEMALLLIQRGYIVDIVDWDNESFVPKKEYDACIGISSDIERMASHLNDSCKKIFHITGAHWQYANHAEYTRLLDLKNRRNVALLPRRATTPNHALEHADFVTILGNDFTQETYAYGNKKMHRIPISTTHQYNLPEEKDWNKACKKFIWISGGGMVHKGLDLVLEAFSHMPDFQLDIFGPVSSEKDFESAYAKELYSTANIHTHGKVDLGADFFLEKASEACGIIHPSSSEGGGGSVVLGMHIGLIPVVSYESSVDVGNFGIQLSSSTVRAITEALTVLSNESPEALATRSKEAWNYARSYHSKTSFSSAYDEFLTVTGL